MFGEPKAHVFEDWSKKQKKSLFPLKRTKGSSDCDAFGLRLFYNPDPQRIPKNFFLFQKHNYVVVAFLVER
jgi:hypothetical protein